MRCGVLTQALLLCACASPAASKPTPTLIPLQAGEQVEEDEPLPVAVTLDGELDTSFGDRGIRSFSPGGGEARLYEIALLPDGSIAGVGHAQFGGQHDICAVRLDENGALDRRFGKNGVARVGKYGGFGHALATDPEGRLIVAGYFYRRANVDTVLARLDRNGVLDPSFGRDGIVLHDAGDDDRPSAVFVQKSGRIVVVSYHSAAKNQAVGFEPDGTIDPSFGHAGTTLFSLPEARPSFATTAELREDGELVVAGYSSSNGLVFVTRLDRDGRLDRRFGTNGTAVLDTLPLRTAWAVGFDAEGRALVGAHTADRRAVVARLDAGGELDLRFGEQGIATVDADAQLYALLSDASGDILGVGFRGLADDASLLAVRMDSRGRIDRSFGDAGRIVQRFGAGTFAFDALLDRAGRLLIAGQAQQKFMVSRWR